MTEHDKRQQFPLTIADREAWDELQELDKRGENLTPFEIEFVESLTKQLRRGRILTSKQRVLLTDINEKRVRRWWRR